MWTLARDPAHYDAIVAALTLRESLRPYVLSLSAEAAATGVPIARPLALEFPTDAASATEAVAARSFMLGSDWLVCPVTTYRAATWSCYLPPLPGGAAWTYWWNGTAVGGGGRTVTTATPIGEFPLFRRGNATA